MTGTFLEAISGPLADLLRAAADWLDSDLEDLSEPEEPEPPAPRWIPNDRGGFDPAA